MPKHAQPSFDDEKNNPDHVPPDIMQINTQHHLRSLFAKELNLIKPLTPMIFELQRTKEHIERQHKCAINQRQMVRNFTGIYLYSSARKFGEQGGEGTGIDLQKLSTKCNVDL